MFRLTKGGASLGGTPLDKESVLMNLRPSFKYRASYVNQGGPLYFGKENTRSDGKPRFAG